MRVFLRALVTLLVAIAFSTDAQPRDPVRTLPTKEKRWALLIGVDRYENPELGLRGAANDARTLRDALVSTAGFPADQVIVLASGEPAERLPTRSNILGRLSNLVTKSVPRDGLFLLAFSGHSIERDGDVYLYPSDIQSTQNVSLIRDTAVSLARVHDQIQSSQIPQVLLLIDSCRNDPGGSRADVPNHLSEGYLKPLSFDIRNKAVRAYATIFATSVNQRAYEYSEKRQGYFTWAIVEGLRGAAANERGEVTLSRLSSYVQEVVPKLVAANLGVDQKPFLKMEGFHADELILAAVPSQPAPPVVDVPSGPPLPRPRIAVVATGSDAVLAEALEQEMERRLAAYGGSDERADADIASLLGKPDLSTTTLSPALSKAGFHILVLVRVENVTEDADSIKHATIRLHAYLLPANRTIGTGWTERIEYAELSLKEKARQAFVGATADLRRSIEAAKVQL